MRDIVVLSLLAQGVDRARITRELSVSESALKRVVREIERNLGAKNRIQAAALAVTLDGPRRMRTITRRGEANEVLLVSVAHIKLESGHSKV